MRKLFIVILISVALLSTLFSQPAVEESLSLQKEMISFTDNAGRTVSIPKDVERVAPSGSVATMFLSAFAPEKMVSVSGRPSKAQMAYLPNILFRLPETGQMYGSKATLNLETLIASEAELVIDLGDYKKGIAEDLDALQEQIGIPVIFIEADLPHMENAFRTLGKVLNMEERGNELGDFVNQTITMAEENSKKIQDNERVSVMYTSGSEGLGTNAKGSTQAQVLDIVGAENAIVVEKISNKGGGNQINLEEAILANPDVILFTEGSIQNEVKDMDGWKEMDAIKNGSYYTIPSSPYNWMGNPPSMNMLLGVWWLGNLIYPQYYSYDMKEKAKEIYSLLWNYELTDEEASNLLYSAK